jgi:hypothetical protein
MAWGLIIEEAPQILDTARLLLRGAASSVVEKNAPVPAVGGELL